MEDEWGVEKPKQGGSDKDDDDEDVVKQVN